MYTPILQKRILRQRGSGTVPQGHTLVGVKGWEQDPSLGSLTHLKHALPLASPSLLCSGLGALGWFLSFNDLGVSQIFFNKSVSLP